ncbi:hypothetical protein ACSRUE_33270 [Sorangium sp. KYC3313]|uniref:hypothetical protein n=1 Tax=Sorangium sp. KYC3313 TaxID=3449740 RepID=UPI003F89F466
MMRRFVQSLCTVVAGLTGCALLMTAAPAEAQEIQLTGPLAGAPAVRKLRLHRDGRFEVAPGASFTLLDEYRRTIMPGLRLTYHFTDWLGFGAWGGYGFQYNAGLTDELQRVAIDGRNCDAQPFTKACQLTSVNLTKGDLTKDQLGQIQWVAAPQVTVVPFRGKLALFAELFVDTDVSFFAGAAAIGVKERKECGTTNQNACSDTFGLESRMAFAPTFGLGWNFYPSDFIGFGAEWRALPFAWNTSGFDNHGLGTDEAFPDRKVDDKDREFHFTSMVTVSLSIQFPTGIKTTE